MATARMTSVAHELDSLADSFDRLIGKLDRTALSNVYVEAGASSYASVLVEEALDAEFAPANFTLGFIRTDGLASRLRVVAIRLRRGEKV